MRMMGVMVLVLGAIMLMLVLRAGMAIMVVIVAMEAGVAMMMMMLVVVEAIMLMLSMVEPEVTMVMMLVLFKAHVAVMMMFAFVMHVMVPISVMVILTVVMPMMMMPIAMLAIVLGAMHVIVPRAMLGMMPRAMLLKLHVIVMIMLLISSCCWPRDLWALRMACMVTMDADLMARRHLIEGLANCLEFREGASTTVMALPVIATLAMALESTFDLFGCFRALRQGAFLVACMVVTTLLVASPDWLHSVAFLPQEQPGLRALLRTRVVTHALGLALLARPHHRLPPLLCPRLLVTAFRLPSDACLERLEPNFRNAKQPKG